MFSNGITWKASLSGVRGRNPREWERDKKWVSLTWTLVRDLGSEDVGDITAAGIDGDITVFLGYPINSYQLETSASVLAFMQRSQGLEG